MSLSRAWFRLDDGTTKRPRPGSPLTIFEERYEALTEGATSLEVSFASPEVQALHNQMARDAYLYNVAVEQALREGGGFEVVLDNDPNAPRNAYTDFGNRQIHLKAPPPPLDDAARAKLAGNLAFEVSVLAEKEAFDAVAASPHTTADAFADAVLRAEYGALERYNAIRAEAPELPSIGATTTPEAFIAAQKQPRDNGKPSLHSFYADQFEDVRDGAPLIVTKPRDVEVTNAVFDPVADYRQKQMWLANLRPVEVDGRTRWQVLDETGTPVPGPNGQSYLDEAGRNALTEEVTNRYVVVENGVEVLYENQAADDGFGQWGTNNANVANRSTVRGRLLQEFLGVDDVSRGLSRIRSAWGPRVGGAAAESFRGLSRLADVGVGASQVALGAARAAGGLAEFLGLGLDIHATVQAFRDGNNVDRGVSVANLVLSTVGTAAGLAAVLGPGVVGAAAFGAAGPVGAAVVVGSIILALITPALNEWFGNGPSDEDIFRDTYGPTVDFLTGANALGVDVLGGPQVDVDTAHSGASYVNGELRLHPDATPEQIAVALGQAERDGDADFLTRLFNLFYLRQTA